MFFLCANLEIAMNECNECQKRALNRPHKTKRDVICLQNSISSFVWSSKFGVKIDSSQVLEPIKQLSSAVTFQS